MNTVCMFMSPWRSPGGVTLMDANEILPREKLFEIKNPVTGNPDVAPFSDLFRYKLLLDRGGGYVDVDTICLADYYPDQIRAWANENEEIEGKLVINAAQMCLPKGDPLAPQLYQRCLQIGHHSELREDWGPNLLTRVIVEMGLPAAIFGTSASFYPIDWIDAVSLVLPGHKGNVERKRCAVRLRLPIFFSILRNRPRAASANSLIAALSAAFSSGA